MNIPFGLFHIYILPQNCEIYNRKMLFFYHFRGIFCFAQNKSDFFLFFIQLKEDNFLDLYETFSIIGNKFKKRTYRVGTGAFPRSVFSNLTPNPNLRPACLHLFLITELSVQRIVVFNPIINVNNSVLRLCIPYVNGFYPRIYNHSFAHCAA